jgi:hypothetical protein
MMLATLYTYHSKIIDEQAMRAHMGTLIRSFSGHESWQLEISGNSSKWAVRWGTDSALELIKNGKAKGEVDVEHAVPVNTMIAELLDIYKNTAKTNPYRSEANLENKMRELSLYLHSNTLLVYVTKDEHKNLPEMPSNWSELGGAHGDPRLWRYKNVNLKRVPWLVVKKPIFERAEQHFT